MKRFRDRVRFFRWVPADTDFASGGGRWELVAKVWGEIEPLRGRALTNAQQQEKPYDHNVMVYFRSDVTDEMQVRDEIGRVFHIRGMARVQETREYFWKIQAVQEDTVHATALEEITRAEEPFKLLVVQYSFNDVDGVTVAEDGVTVQVLEARQGALDPGSGDPPEWPEG